MPPKTSPEIAQTYIDPFEALTDVTPEVGQLAENIHRVLKTTYKGTVERPPQGFRSSSLVQKYWDTEGCSTCPFCEKAQFGGYVQRLVRHQGRVDRAALVFAQFGRDDDVVQASQKSIMDGLEAYSLSKALVINPVLPKTLARLETVLADEDYKWFSADTEDAIAANLQKAHIGDRQPGSRSPSIRASRIIGPHAGLPDYRYKLYKEVDPELQQVACLRSGLEITRAISLFRQLPDKPTTTIFEAYDYAINYLEGFVGGELRARTISPSPEIHPALQNDQTVDDMTKALYSEAYLDLGDNETAYRHAVYIVDRHLRLETMCQLASRGVQLAYDYLDAKFPKQ